MKRLFLLSFALAACLRTLSAQESAETPPNYVIQPSDVLRLMVFQEPDLEQEFRVAQNGEHQFPLIGSVKIAGKTVAEAEDLMRELYERDYLVNPQINLQILEFSPRRVNVLGAVNTPGTVVFPPEESMNLLDAISRAGGFNRLARTSRVTITRQGPDGEPIRIRVDADDLMKEGRSGRGGLTPSTGGKETTSGWDLQKDDVIFVPERIL